MCKKTCTRLIFTRQDVDMFESPYTNQIENACLICCSGTIWESFSKIKGGENDIYFLYMYDEGYGDTY